MAWVIPFVLFGLLIVFAVLMRLRDSRKHRLRLAIEAGDALWTREIVTRWLALLRSLRHGLPPLHDAASIRQVDVARTLLQLGADPNRADGHGFAPLHHAAMFNPLSTP
jgi:ankyrin repeat protein